MSEITYGKIREIILQSLDLYSSVQGIDLILLEQQKQIDRLMEISGDKIQAILSLGYPNWILTPTFWGKLDEGLVLEGEFTPVEEIEKYHQRTLAAIDQHSPDEAYPCIGHYEEASLKTLRPPECENCTRTGLEPILLFTTIPDIDLFIVVRTKEDAQEIVEQCKEANMNCVEEALAVYLLEFPEKIATDFIYITEEEFRHGLKRLSDSPTEWTSVGINVLKNWGGLLDTYLAGFGLDFMFSLVPHTFADPELARQFIDVRYIVMTAQPVDNIIEQIRNSRYTQGLPHRIGKLVDNYPLIESYLRRRIQAYSD
ncbi:hypothetical protein JXB41_00485 [Candidatus Woesearchaeota archaeon]|nr:hypothetical protein [Candidatus Woesearchaeota archaeon]